MVLDLVAQDGGVCDGPPQVRRGIVADTEVADLTLALKIEHGVERGLGFDLGAGPVDQQEVDILDAEPPKAGLGGRPNERRCVVPGVDLGRDEHLVAREAAVDHGRANGCFILVRLWRVDMPVADLERVEYGIATFIAPKRPGAEAYYGHTNILECLNDHRRGRVRLVTETPCICSPAPRVQRAVYQCC